MKELILVAALLGMFGYAGYKMSKSLTTVKANVEKIALDSYK